MYKIEKDKSSGSFLVVERDEHVIREYDSYDKAKEFVRSIKKGKGFNGYTPTFVVTFLKFMRNAKFK